MEICGSLKICIIQDLRYDLVLQGEFWEMVTTIPFGQ